MLYQRHGAMSLSMGYNLQPEFLRLKRGAITVLTIINGNWVDPIGPSVVLRPWSGFTRLLIGPWVNWASHQIAQHDRNREWHAQSGSNTPS